MVDLRHLPVNLGLMKEFPSGENIVTSIWYEMLPVTLEAGCVVTLRRREESEDQSWLIPHQVGQHPNETALEQVRHFFGELFEPESSILHSTSWRYCQSTERLLLTYLLVLPQHTWISCQAAGARLVARRVGTRELVRGDHLHAPARIEVDHVLAHALDHLAWLDDSDENIHAVLETGWREMLQMRLPKPAGHLA